MVSSRQRLRQEEYLANELQPPEEPPSPIYIDDIIDMQTDMRTSSVAFPVPTSAPTVASQSQSQSQSLPTPTSTPTYTYDYDYTPSPSFLFISPYSIFLLVMVGIVFLTRIIIILKERKTRHRQQQQQQQQQLQQQRQDNEGIHDYLRNSDNVNDVMSMFTNHHGRLAVQLGTEDRVKLYRRAFERSTHFHKLTAEDFLLPEHKKHDDEDDNSEVGNNNDGFIIDDIDIDDADIESSGKQNCEYECDEEDSPCIYLSLQSSSSSSSHHPEEESSSAVPKQDNINASSENTTATASETIVDGTTAATTNTSSSSSTTTTTTTTIAATKTKIPGTCIICLEDFSVGETVVYSDNPDDTCKHIFHEDCMARYLASHSQRTHVGGSNNNNTNSNIYNSSYAHNPCPTCRQPFCQVSNDDLILAVLLKSIQVALQEGQHNSSRLPVVGETTSPTTNMNIIDSSINSNINSIISSINSSSSINSNSERFIAGLNR